MKGNVPETKKTFIIVGNMHKKASNCETFATGDRLVSFSLLTDSLIGGSGSLLNGLFQKKSTPPRQIARWKFSREGRSKALEILAGGGGLDLQFFFRGHFHLDLFFDFAKPLL